MQATKSISLDARFVEKRQKAEGRRQKGKGKRQGAEGRRFI
jgi:hypothetical protein